MGEGREDGATCVCVPDVVRAAEGNRGSQNDATVRSVTVEKGSEISKCGSLSLAKVGVGAWRESEESGTRKELMAAAQQALQSRRQSRKTVATVESAQADKNLRNTVRRGQIGVSEASQGRESPTEG